MLARVARRFCALSDPSRLRVLQYVCGRPASVSEIAAETGLGVANVSRHLTRLMNEAFVERRSEGRFAIYRVADDTPTTLCAAICEHLTASDARLARA